ncbi:hypothetical protein HHI36_013628, partial [Cryptolaemus montrouzieri]
TSEIKVNGVRVLLGTMCDSDHHLVRAIVFFAPTNQKQQINKDNEGEIKVNGVRVEKTHKKSSTIWKVSCKTASDTYIRKGWTKS